jgi:hypothetical protein
MTSEWLIKQIEITFVKKQLHFRLIPMRSLLALARHAARVRREPRKVQNAPSRA